MPLFLTNLIGLLLVGNTMTFSVADILLAKYEPIITEVMRLESGGKENAYNKDDGGSPSVGCLQFKEATFFEKVRKFELFGGLDKADLQNRFYDCYSQKIVMAMMLEEEEKPLCHWENTSKSLRKYKC